MSLLKKIRNVLGLGGSETTEGTDVSVERKPDGDSQQAAAAGTDASASTGSISEEPTSDPETAAEPAEAAGPVSDEPEGGAEPAESVDSASDEPEGDAEPVESVSGIGPAYAKRLNEVGIESVQDLLDADPAELSEQTDVSEKRITRWQERAETA